jgi:hypothetical protein
MTRHGRLFAALIAVLCPAAAPVTGGFALRSGTLFLPSNTDVYHGPVTGNHAR